MTWIMILEIFFKVFGPYILAAIKKLIDRLFKKAMENKLSSLLPELFADRPEDGVKAMFGAIDAELPRVAVARRLLLKICERIAVKHASKLMKGEMFELNEHEIEEVKLACKLAA